MHIVTARLKTRVLDGIEMVGDHVPIGKCYRVDLDLIEAMHWYNAERGPQRTIDCVPDVNDGGMLPLEILEIEATQ